MDAQFTKLEAKLDKLAEGQALGLTNLARVDEKLTAAIKRIDRLEFRLDEYEGELDSIKGTVGNNSQSTQSLERFVWLIISSIVGVLAYNFRV